MLDGYFVHRQCMNNMFKTKLCTSNSIYCNNMYVYQVTKTFAAYRDRSFFIARDGGGGGVSGGFWLRYGATNFNWSPQAFTNLQ